MYFLPYLANFELSWQNEKGLSFEADNRKRPFLNGRNEFALDGSTFMFTGFSELVTKCPYRYRCNLYTSVAGHGQSIKAKDHHVTCKWGPFSVIRQEVLNERDDFSSVPTLWQPQQKPNGHHCWKLITPLLRPKDYWFHLHCDLLQHQHTKNTHHRN